MLHLIIKSELSHLKHDKDHRKYTKLDTKLLPGEV